MINIGSSPPPGTAQTAAAGANTVTEPSAVQAAKDRKHKADGEDAAKDETASQQDGDDANELTDEMLLKVVRAFSGERGAVVDKKV